MLRTDISLARWQSYSRVYLAAQHACSPRRTHNLTAWLLAHLTRTSRKLVWQAIPAHCSLLRCTISMQVMLLHTERPSTYVMVPDGHAAMYVRRSG